MSKVPLGTEDAALALAEAEPRFAPLVEHFGTPQVPPGGRPFQALVEAVAEQQLSTAAGAAIVGRLRDRLGPDYGPKVVASTDREALRSCGLSRTKADTVRELAEAALSGALPLDRLDDLSDQEAIEAISTIRGIGPWTVQMVLIFDQHRLDVLASTDLGVRDGIRRLFELDERPTPTQVVERARPWRPYRSLACWYLWRERDRQLRGEGTR